MKQHEDIAVSTKFLEVYIIQPPSELGTSVHKIYWVQIMTVIKRFHYNSML